VYDADQTLGERRIAVKAMAVVSEPGTPGDENQGQRLPGYIRVARELPGKIGDQGKPTPSLNGKLTAAAGHVETTTLARSCIGAHIAIVESDLDLMLGRGCILLGLRQDGGSAQANCESQHCHSTNARHDISSHALPSTSIALYSRLSWTVLVRTSVPLVALMVMV
jgi:hypothetical protein